MSIKIDWQPAIGDPTPAGWVTVVAYFGTAVICYLASTSARARLTPQLPFAHNEARFWNVVTIFMAVLGLNKQLDLQSLLTQIVRFMAVAGGWYHQRHTIQLLFVICLGSSAIIAAIVLLRVFRKAATEIRFATMGLCLLGAFIVIRAASFHHIDTVFRADENRLGWNTILELGSIIFVATAGFWYRRHPSTDS